MNIAFFGTSDKSLPLLEALKNSKYNLNLCVTKNDKKVGRDQKLKQTGVSKFALRNCIHFVTTSDLSTINTNKVLSALKKHNIELIIVADYSFIIPQEIFNLPSYKTINIHFSLLPSYRGASPVQFAILNQDKITGITYQTMALEMDTGPIIHQTKYKLLGNETTKSLYEKLFEISSKELPNIIENYTKEIYKLEPQNENKATYTYSPTHPQSTLIYKSDAKINWGRKAKEIDAMVRAFNPWPTAWTTLEQIGTYFKNINIKQGNDLNKRVKIYQTEVDKNNNLNIKTLKVAGKNKVRWKDFVSGYCKKIKTT